MIIETVPIVKKVDAVHTINARALTLSTDERPCNRFYDIVQHKSLRTRAFISWLRNSEPHYAVPGSSLNYIVKDFQEHCHTTDAEQAWGELL